MPNTSEARDSIPRSEEAASRSPITQAIETVELDRQAQITGNRLGRPSLYTCPDCSGLLWQVNESELIQFRCHVGHILTGESLLAGQTAAAENSLWYTIRTLTDQMVLARELAEYARRHGNAEAVAEFEAQAQTAEQKFQALRQVAEG
jgi:two-component system chemotaxis response regulator CheB